MDFIKNLFSNSQSVDTNGATIPEELSKKNCDEHLYQDLNIQDLMTSQSSDDISDVFRNELSNDVSNSPKNTEKNELTINSKDFREFTADRNCKSAILVPNENLTSICTNDNSAGNIEETVLNLDEFEASFNEVNRNIGSECDKNYKFKENNVIGEPLLNLDDFEEFLDKVQNDINCNEIDETVSSENNIENALGNNNKPLNVADENINTEICLDEFENIFKSYDNNNNSEKVQKIDDSASSVITETIENTYVTEVPIELNETEMIHDFNNLLEDINMLTEEFEHDNIKIESIEFDIDFEADLKSNIISKLDPMVVIETDNQPMIWKDVNSDLSNIERNAVYEQVNELEDDKNSVISISDENSDHSYIENNTVYEDLNEKHEKTNVISISDVNSEENNTVYEDLNENHQKTNVIPISDVNSEENNTVYEDLNDKHDKTSVISISDENSDHSYIENNTVYEDLHEKTNVISISDVNLEEKNTVYEDLNEKHEKTNVISDVNKEENNTVYEDLNDKHHKTSVMSTSSKTTNSTKPMDTSVISAENKKHEDSDYCSGYNSSDFEFITEDEAQDGLIINCCNKKLDTPKKSSTVHILEISIDKSYKCGSSEESIEIENPGPSNNRNYKNVYKPMNTNYRQNHRIPVEDEYLNLFQRIEFQSDLLFLENKSVRPTTSMSMQFRDVGFDMVGVRKEDSEDGYKDEAEESAKKILTMYPGENRKRRRRRF